MMKYTTSFLCVWVMGAGLLVASCGDDDNGTGTANAPVTVGDGADGTVDAPLTILYWQAPSIANPYLSGGFKDIDASALALEPLANYDENGTLVPRLAEDIPTIDNGGVSQDLTTITWRLKSGVLWSDGTPLTAEDAAFTHRYVCSLPEARCDVGPIMNVEAVNDVTLTITFRRPTPHPYTFLVGAESPILQEAQFENCVGEASRQCRDENLRPIGTGPYTIVDFAIDEMENTSVVTYAMNGNFRVPDQPFFSEVTIKGGGDAATVARAVLETGEADYGWNIQVEPQLLQSLQTAGRGMVATTFSSLVERLDVNFTNPDPALGDKRSEWSVDDPNPHPVLSDQAVRQALSLAIDRGQIAEQLYGLTGRPTCNIVPAPPQYASPNNDSCLTQNIAAANALLDDAGWLTGADNVRQKDGIRLTLLYQTSTNAVRQTTQDLIQQWWRAIGVETTLRDVPADVFFSSDPDSPDTIGRFYADIQMYTSGGGVDPQGYMRNWRTTEIARADNNWNGGNVPRWFNTAYDDLYTELESAPVGPTRENLVIQLNDLLIQNYVLIPLVDRASVSVFHNSLKGVRLNAWDSELWNIHEWHRE